jgi:predicted alpha/beta-hydrolase family hydrolase
VQTQNKAPRIKISRLLTPMPPSPERFTDTSLDPQVRGFLHRPDAPSGDGLVLAHGAGSSSGAPPLVALAEAFAGVGFTVLRCDLPYRQTRSFGPPRPGDAARDRAGLKNAVAAIRKLAPGRMFLGGHSYGGRQATMLCAEEPGLANGLLLLSYPLHPPRKPQQLRIQHLPKLETPALFIHGTRDPFGSPEELESALRLIPAKTRLLTIDGAGHDLGFKGKAKQDDVPALVLKNFQEFFG